MEINTDSVMEEYNLLQALVVRNPDLERLESMLDRFNIFEALGAVRQEVRHSDFLAFLLDPRQNHGLGDLFVKRLLQESIAQADFAAPITPIDLDIWDMDEIDVRREWQSIDILILDENHKLVVVIENKVYSGEHDDQLSRYVKVVKQHYPGYHIIKLFLTPEGDRASDPGYISISYSLLCELVENITQTRESTLEKDILVLMNHYAVMLRRYIVGESEIEKLCQQIYRKHKRALDLIYEYRPDQLAEIKDFLCNLVNSNPLFEMDHFSKSYINFIPKTWDSAIMRSGQGWTRSGRMLLFQFTNVQDLVRISLVLGPGPDYIRNKLFDVISHHGPPFKHSLKTIGRMWSTVYSRNILTKTNYKDNTTEELLEEIRRRWNDFLEHEFPKFDDVLLQEIRLLDNINH